MPHDLTESRSMEVGRLRSDEAERDDIVVGQRRISFCDQLAG